MAIESNPFGGLHLSGQLLLPAITSIKGFNADLTCLDYQYVVGETFTHVGTVVQCRSGFHACPVNEHPLTVFQYYAPAGSRFFEVRQSGQISKGADGKVASERITIDLELAIGDLVQRAWDYVWSRCTKSDESHSTGYQGAASATSVRGAASATGYRGAASATGDGGAASATGYQGAASATGDWGAASATGVQGTASATGVRGVASATGVRGAASATGYQGAASATGVRGAASATSVRGAASATGYQGAASATGVQGTASATGYQGAASATGDWGAAMSVGYNGKVMGALGTALFAVERDLNYKITSVAAGIVGNDGIESGVWYLCCAGKLVAALDVMSPP